MIFQNLGNTVFPAVLAPPRDRTFVKCYGLLSFPKNMGNLCFNKNQKLPVKKKLAYFKHVSLLV